MQQGININHGFALWFTARKLRPPVVIESGVYHGLGTWLIRQGAGPDTHIINLDPSPSSQLRYKESEGTHLMGANFSDFGLVNWHRLIPDSAIRARTLVVLDDHMSCVKRVGQMLDAGFRHLFYEDNWALPKDGIGAFPDSYSFNAVCAPVQIERARTYSQPTKENEPTSALGIEPPPDAPHPFRRLRRDSVHAQPNCSLNTQDHENYTISTTSSAADTRSRSKSMRPMSSMCSRIWSPTSSSRRSMTAATPSTGPPAVCKRAARIS